MRCYLLPTLRQIPFFSSLVSPVAKPGPEDDSVSTKPFPMSLNAKTLHHRIFMTQDMEFLNYKSIFTGTHTNVVTNINHFSCFHLLLGSPYDRSLKSLKANERIRRRFTEHSCFTVFSIAHGLQTQDKRSVSLNKSATICRLRFHFIN